MEIEETLASLERLAAKENAVYEEFKEFLGDNHKWGDFLHKVYRKRVKRKAKGAATGKTVVQRRLGAISCKVSIILAFNCVSWVDS